MQRALTCCSVTSAAAPVAPVNLHRRDRVENWKNHVDGKTAAMEPLLQLQRNGGPCQAYFTLRLLHAVTCRDLATIGCGRKCVERMPGDQPFERAIFLMDYRTVFFPS